VNRKEYDGDTPLHAAAAAYEGKKDILELFIAKGADVNVRNNDGNTPLHDAVTYGGNKKEIAELLISKGANIYIENNKGEKPVDLVNKLSDQKQRDELMAVLKTKNNSREELTGLLDSLRASPGERSVREKVIKLAKELRPAPVVPEEAERYLGRAQYAFKNAKSEADFISAAREYMKAVEAAPWVADYYYDLCVILESANRYKEAANACRFFIKAIEPQSDEAREARKKLGGLEYAMEQKNKEEESKCSKKYLRDLSVDFDGYSACLKANEKEGLGWISGE
jgi:hypothetical protein